jgi:hypothetical protein
MWAIPSHVAAMPRPIALRARARGPGPDGFFFAVVRERVDALRLDEEDRRAWLPDEPDRELEDFELRDLGGEDVRVAMVARLGADHTSHTRPTPTPHDP